MRAVFRLVAELRELGRDPHAWPRHMAAELIRLIGAKAAFTGEGYAAGGNLLYNGFVSVGLTDSADQRGFERFATSPVVSGHRFMRAFADHYRQRFIASRDMLFSDAEWYASDYYHDYRAPSGVDAWLHSQFYLPATRGIHMVCINRPPGDPRFGPKELRLLKLFHDEMRQVWRDPRPGLIASTPDLPPRLRQTLARLQAGDSEKQAAAYLGVSTHAVHQHVKRLHQVFGVSSRGELLAATRSAPYDFRPRLLGPPEGWTLGRRGAEAAMFEENLVTV